MRDLVLLTHSKLFSVHIGLQLKFLQSRVKTTRKYVSIASSRQWMHLLMRCTKIATGLSTSAQFNFNIEVGLICYIRSGSCILVSFLLLGVLNQLQLISFPLLTMLKVNSNLSCGGVSLLSKQNR